MANAMPRRTLCVIVCGAGPAVHVGRLIEPAVEQGWTVQVIPTPAAAAMLDEAALAGADVFRDYSGGVRGPADAVLIAPATFNTVNKLARGIADNYAMTVAAEAIGKGTRVVVLPFVNAALASRRPFVAAVESLRAEGVDVLIGPDSWTPHEPGAGDDVLDTIPWETALRRAVRTG